MPQMFLILVMLRASKSSFSAGKENSPLELLFMIDTIIYKLIDFKRNFETNLIHGMAPWCSGLTCHPVTVEIVGSNPIGVANIFSKFL